MKYHTKSSLLIRVLKATDCALFAMLCAAGLWIPLRSEKKIFAASALLFLSVLIFLLLLDRRTRKRQIKNIREAVRNAIRIEKIMLLPDEEVQKTLIETDCVLIRRTDAGESDIVSALRQNPRMIAVPCDTDRFTSLIRTHAPHVRLIGREVLLKRFSVDCTEEEIETRMQPNKKARIRFSIRIRGNQSKFFVLGGLFLLLSFIVRCPVYYRMLSSACFILGAFAALIGRTRQKEADQ